MLCHGRPVRDFYLLAAQTLHNSTESDTAIIEYISSESDSEKEDMITDWSDSDKENEKPSSDKEDSQGMSLVLERWTFHQEVPGMHVTHQRQLTLIDNTNALAA